MSVLSRAAVRIRHAIKREFFAQRPVQMQENLDRRFYYRRFASRIEVNIVRLDAVIPRAPRPVNFVNIDVEGVEFEALVGAARPTE